MDRAPVAAGTFYPASPSRLKTLLDDLFQQAQVLPSSEPVLAVIAPHAGYVFSGQVAAAAIAQIDPNKVYQHIFLIGSSHTHMFKGASIYTQGDYVTPLGKVPVDPLAKQLLEQHAIFVNNPEIQEHEHALEVIIPFLQFRLKQPFSIIPIIVGGESEDIPQKLADILRPYLNENNLFVISSDFSHYPAYNDAMMSDNTMADAIVSGLPERFLLTKKEIENRHIPRLATTACGWTAILTLLYMINGNPQYSIKKIAYQNSGDSPFGEKNKVVGYHAIAVYKNKTPENPHIHKEEEIVLNSADKNNLLIIARNTLEKFVLEHVRYNIPPSLITPELQQKRSAFVTLRKAGKLRGCIGTFQPRHPLYLTIRDLTISSAAHDYRFDPVTPEELEHIEIEISVLTPLRKIQNIDEIELGRDGILIKKGMHSGTFLPQVATQMHWTKEEFLGHCARDKAGIGWEGWKNAEIYTFRTIIIEETQIKT